MTQNPTPGPTDSTILATSEYTKDSRLGSVIWIGIFIATVSAFFGSLFRFVSHSDKGWIALGCYLGEILGIGLLGHLLTIFVDAKFRCPARIVFAQRGENRFVWRVEVAERRSRKGVLRTVGGLEFSRLGLVGFGLHKGEYHDFLEGYYWDPASTLVLGYVNGHPYNSSYDISAVPDEWDSEDARHTFLTEVNEFFDGTRGHALLPAAAVDKRATPSRGLWGRIVGSRKSSERTKKSTPASSPKVDDLARYSAPELARKASRLASEVADEYARILCDYHAVISMPAVVSPSFTHNERFLSTLVALEDLQRAYRRKETHDAAVGWWKTAQQAREQLTLLVSEATRVGPAVLDSTQRVEMYGIATKLEKVAALRDGASNDEEREAAAASIEALHAALLDTLNAHDVRDGQIRSLVGTRTLSLAGTAAA